MPIEREVLDDGSVRLSSGNCVFHYRRLQPGALVISISGSDQGQFGSETVDEAAREFGRTDRPVSLFIDTRQASGPAMSVSELWTAWFAANRHKLDRVVILVEPESKYLHLTISIAQHLSRTRDLIRVCGTPEEFEAAMRRARGEGG